MSSIIDLTFISSRLARKNVPWKVTEVYSGSEHRAIYWEVSNTEN